MQKLIPVWDLPTRLFHWILAMAVFYSWFSIEILEDMQQHFYSGYLVLTLLLFRLVWGLVGSHYARFRSFHCSPSKILMYAQTILSSTGKRYLGHNPLGSLSAILMIIALLTQAGLGLFSSDDYFFGPLSGLVSGDTMSLVSEYHLLNSDVVFVLIGVHIAAIIYYKLRKNENLTKAMISGNKILSESIDYADQAPIKPTNKLLALIVLLLCITAVYWLATAFLDRIPTSTESYY